MKRSEVIKKYRDKIEKEMVECYRSVLECRGCVQYDVYVWDDGEIRVHEDVQGSNSQLVPYDAETRKLFFVDTIEMPFYDPWDSQIDAPPEDEEEREHMEKEIIDYEVEEYESNVSGFLSDIIEEARQNERYGYDAE